MSPRILVLDDDRESVRLVRACLEQCGYEVLATYDGELARHLLHREHPSPVLLDLHLPVRDGSDGYRGLRGVSQEGQGGPSLPTVIQVQGLTVDLAARRVEVGGRPVHLTPTEFALLRVLAEQPGYTLNRQEMIRKGLGFGYEGLERTVDSHVKNLRAKLDAAGEAAHLVETVFGVGYRLSSG